MRPEDRDLLLLVARRMLSARRKSGSMLAPIPPTKLR
jgi:hypothetical protein